MTSAAAVVHLIRTSTKPTPLNLRAVVIQGPEGNDASDCRGRISRLTDSRAAKRITR